MEIQNVLPTPGLGRLWRAGRTSSAAGGNAEPYSGLGRELAKCFTELNVLLPYDLVIVLGVHSNEVKLMSPQEPPQEQSQQFYSLLPYLEATEMPFNG